MHSPMYALKLRVEAGRRPAVEVAGSKACRCGATISQNKEQCRACFVKGQLLLAEKVALATREGYAIHSV